MALGLRPNDLVLLANKAVGYRSLGKLQKTVDTCRDAIKLNDNYCTAHEILGNALQEMGKYGEAIESYQRALKNAGSDSWYQNHIEARIAECRYRMIQSP